MFFMKTGGKSILSFIIILSLTSIFLTSLVVAQSAWDPVKSMFADWQDGNLSVNIVKYIVWILITMVVFMVVGFIPMLKKMNGFFKFLFSLIVAFLSVAYLIPEDIKLALVSYGAMALILTAILPFLIILFFSIELRKDYSNSGIGVLLGSYVLWIGFAVFLVWKAGVGAGWWGTLPAGVQPISGGAIWVYLGIALLSILALFLMGRIERFLAKKDRELSTDVMNREVDSELDDEMVLRRQDAERAFALKQRNIERKRREQEGS